MDRTKIYFEDKGQDFLNWTVDEQGKVIDSNPFQKVIWEGCWVDLKQVKVGKKLYFLNKHDQPVVLNYKVVKIEKE